MAAPKATIVLDTSALLNALDLITQIYEHARPYGIELLLPLTAIRELDSIKDREGFSARGITARKTVNWVNDVLTVEDVDNPVLRGQRQSEVVEPGLKADDSIIDCCLYNKAHRRTLTILMADDRNLCNRALIEHLETLDTSSASAHEICEAVRERTANIMDLDSSFDAPETQWTAHTPADPEVSESASVDMDIDADAMDGDAPQTDALVVDSHAPGQPAATTTDQTAEDSAGSREYAPRAGQPLVSRWSTSSPQRRKERSAPKPKKASIDIQPVRLEDKRLTLVSNAASLVDWHLRRETPAEDLEMLGYKGPPSDQKKLISLIKIYFVPVFRYIIRRTTLERAEKSLSLDGGSAEFLAAWAELVVELAQHDAKYVDLVQSL